MNFSEENPELASSGLSLAVKRESRASHEMSRIAVLSTIKPLAVKTRFVIYL